MRSVSPLWSDRAVEQVAASVDMTDDETYFTLTTDGPDALPPNSTVEAIRETQSVNLTLADGLGVGESLSVYYPSDGGPPQLVDTPPSAENATTLSGTYDFVVRTPDGQEVVFIGFGFGTENATETNALVGPSVTFVADGVVG